MELWPVDRKLDNVRNKGADLIGPVALSAREQADLLSLFGEKNPKTDS
jgi:hypothetical protein